MRNAGLVITRAMLENALPNSESERTSNVIDVYIKRLRAKIEFGEMRPLLATVRGIGYRFG
jgi:DNA-binding response OmpR family regulator